MSKIKEGFEGNDASKPSCVRGDPISGGIRKEVVAISYNFLNDHLADDIIIMF